MQVQRFTDRHRLIDRLRYERAFGAQLMADQQGVRALLDEIDLLQRVADAASTAAGLAPQRGAGAPADILAGALKSWQE